MLSFFLSIQLIIESSNGPQMLLRILELTDYEKLSWTTTRLLRVLSVSSSIKSMMIANNAVQILGKELYQPISLRVQQSCLQILRNLSDQAVKLVCYSIRNSIDAIQHEIFSFRLGESRLISTFIDRLVTNK